MLPGEKIHEKPTVDSIVPEKKPVSFGFKEKEAELEQLQQKLAEAEKDLAKMAEKKVEVEQKPEVSVVEAEPKVEEGAVTKERSEAATTPPPPPPTPTPPTAQDTKEIKKLDHQNQVKILCDLAFRKGISDAIKTARDLDNAYVLDEFHDALIDQLYQKLIEEKKISKV